MSPHNLVYVMSPHSHLIVVRIVVRIVVLIVVRIVVRILVRIVVRLVTRLVVRIDDKVKKCKGLSMSPSITSTRTMAP